MNERSGKWLCGRRLCGQRKSQRVVREVDERSISWTSIKYPLMWECDIFMNAGTAGFPAQQSVLNREAKTMESGGHVSENPQFEDCLLH